MVNFKINGTDVSCPETMTILDAAKQIGVDIPTLCFLREINEITACRICLVEIKGQEQLVPACGTRPWEGIEVFTDSQRVRRARETNLRLILSQHESNCTMCVRCGNCTLQTLAKEFNLVDTPFTPDIRHKPWPKDSYLIRNEAKCVKCMRCIQVCRKVQGMNVWDIVGSGSRTTVGTSGSVPFESMDCALCGQCITHCPTGALTIRDDTRKAFDALRDPEKVTVIQVAPAVRAAWAENLGLDHEAATTGRMVTALRKIGFDYVFDTNFTADLTIMEESNELIDRIVHKDEHSWPMFTSCCPGWIRFVKAKYPEFIPNLSTAKSPQQMFGAVAKTYFAEKIGTDPRNIFVVSVMPCTAKKSEAADTNQKDGYGDPYVDLVLTTRELSRMIRSACFSVEELEESPFDSPLGTGTGAAVIFGATGGVMDAALRTAYHTLTGKNPDADAFKAVRGLKGRKEAELEIPGTGTVKVAVVSGLGNAKALLEDIKAGNAAYDFVEVMACPGGCAGGGGQPIHDGSELADERGSILWKLDSKSSIRFSHENPEVLTLYREYLGEPLGERSHHLLHTDHAAWGLHPGK